jgi:short-subunit dehydrogenase
VTFANQVAIITGASSGIGWELAKQLATSRCAVGVVARRKDRLETLVQEIQATGGKAACAVADVAERAPTVAAIKSLREQLGPVDLLIANSGVGVPTTLEPLNVDEVEKMFKVNTLGVVYAIEAVLPEMLERRSGHLVAISSLAAYLPMPGESGYCASKAAVNVYMEALGLHLRGRGVHVTTVCPGFIDTPMTAVNTFKMPWLLKADRAAELILRAIARKQRVYNFPWQTTLLTKFAAWLPKWMLIRAIADKTGDRPKPSL